MRTHFVVVQAIGGEPLAFPAPHCAITTIRRILDLRGRDRERAAAPAALDQHRSATRPLRAVLMVGASRRQRADRARRHRGHPRSTTVTRGPPPGPRRSRRLRSASETGSESGTSANSATTRSSSRGRTGRRRLVGIFRTSSVMRTRHGGARDGRRPSATGGRTPGTAHRPTHVPNGPPTPRSAGSSRTGHWPAQTGAGHSSGTDRPERSGHRQPDHSPSSTSSTSSGAPPAG